MAKGAHRFTVDPDGRVTDRESNVGHQAEFWQALREGRAFNAIEPVKPPPEVQERWRRQQEEHVKQYLRKYQYEMSEYGLQLGGLLLGLGLVSLDKASASDPLGWWLWGILGILLIGIGSLVAIFAAYDNLRGPSDNP